MIDNFSSLAAALSPHGIIARVNDVPYQLIISAQRGPVWPDRGNSFWVTRQDDHWYLVTWLPASYRVPADGDILALCLDCMAVGTSAMYRVPDDLVARHRLEPVDEEVMERLLPPCSES